ncbi:hypothetical protein [Bacillus sp. FSL R12-0069]|uniref:hypothetical protein n=1 Tax=Bacillus sp. FSL R12-0069 TaxID=2975342 RepID=UPI0030F8FA2F
MEFWVLAYLYQEDVYYDFAKEDITYGYTSTCFLPTEETAQKYIDENNGSDEFIPVKVTVHALHNASWTSSRGTVDHWGH